MYEGLSMNERMDLTNICNYLKSIVVPNTPKDFIAAEIFKNDITDDEVSLGINSFRKFLYNLYDNIATHTEIFTIPKSKDYYPEAFISGYFPAIYKLADILFEIGIHGKFENESKTKLNVNGADLLKLNAKKYKQKSELFSFLSDIGFCFEDLDFSNEIDFSKVGSFYVSFKLDDFLLTGLKLLAQAQANTNAEPIKVFMRGYFYPLASAKLVKYKADINDFSNSLPLETKKWALKMDKLLISKGCKIIFNHKAATCSCIFDYISDKSNKNIYRIQIGTSGFIIVLMIGDTKEDIQKKLRKFPDNLRDEIINNKTKGCRLCKGSSCRINFDFEHEDKKYNLCSGKGYIRRNPTKEQLEFIKRIIDRKFSCT